MSMKAFQKAECKIMFVSQLYLQDQYARGTEELTTVFKCSDDWQKNCHLLDNFIKVNKLTYSLRLHAYRLLVCWHRYQHIFFANLEHR